MDWLIDCLIDWLIGRSIDQYKFKSAYWIITSDQSIDVMRIISVLKKEQTQKSIVSNFLTANLLHFCSFQMSSEKFVLFTAPSINLLYWIGSHYNWYLYSDLDLDSTGILVQKKIYFFKFWKKNYLHIIFEREHKFVRNFPAESLKNLHVWFSNLFSRFFCYSYERILISPFLGCTKIFKIFKFEAIQARSFKRLKPVNVYVRFY